MKKFSIAKLLDLVKSLQGKSKVLVVTVVLVFVIGALAIQLGYVSADLLDSESLMNFLNDLVASESTNSVDSVIAPVEVIDSVIAPVDSLQAVVVDSVSIK